MRLTVKILQGGECCVNVPETAKVSEVKTCVEQLLNVQAASQRLVFKGKTLADDMTLTEAGVTEATKIHMMVKKGEGVAATTTNSTSPSPASSSKTPAPLPPLDFFVQLDAFLSKHLTQEQTNKVVNEFRKNCQLMVDSMNFEDIERFAASGCTEF
ncbi:ubiquitin-like protein 4A [Eriocheir sinensis]|uniref:ubiquitin-like protein 4A n=1 Tax=Eriocheir sinensis TaxID=95602 RepID=UPI0021C973B9|nr:ubiquitin-like protein 4A [Eriocheir sinensis]